MTLAILVIGIGYGIYWQTVLRFRETTDDAYVNGNIVQITPQIAGTVVGINADDTQYVAPGQTLVRLDPADAKVALDEAEAQLALTVRSVRGLFATTAQLAAAQGIRQTDLDTAQKDLARRERLAGSGAISGEELQHARDAVSAAKSGAARGPAAVRRRSRPHRWHADRGPSGSAGRGRRGAQRLSDRWRAPSCRRRWRASSPIAMCSWASVSAPARC